MMRRSAFAATRGGSGAARDAGGGGGGAEPRRRADRNREDMRALRQSLLRWRVKQTVEHAGAPPDDQTDNCSVALWPVITADLGSELGSEHDQARA